MAEDQVIQMPLMRIAEGCTAGRAPDGATWQEREALLDQYDVVLVSPSLMITRLSRMSKLTAGTVTTAMTDQYDGHLRDIPARAGGPPAAGKMDRQQP